MLKFTEDLKKVKIWYQFRSGLVDFDYSMYEYDEFCYTIDIDEAKEVICFQLGENIERKEVSLTLIEALNELDAWECIDWLEIIKKCEDLLEEHYEYDAMQYFIDEIAE